MPAMPESKGLHDVFRPGGSLAVLEPSPDAPFHAPSAAASGTAASAAAVVDPAEMAFPREEDIRLAQDLLFFAYRDFTNAADVALEELGLGRAHHRALHFIGRNPGITVSELLAILRITKQSLARVLGALLDQGYVAQAQGDQDRRQRLLTLTPAGQTLERRLFERQQARLAVAYRHAGPASVEGFRSVMLGIMDEEACRAIAEKHPMLPLNTTAPDPARPDRSTSDESTSGATTSGATTSGATTSGATRPTGAAPPAMRPGGSSSAQTPPGNTSAAEPATAADAPVSLGESPSGAAWLTPVEQR
jgi:DNA-binding MarR family transcriptional regulator